MTGRTPRAVAEEGAQRLRWAVPIALLAAEWGLLTLIGDYPTTGAAARLVPLVRTAMPVIFAAAASAWMIARFAGPPGEDDQGEPLPPWRPGLPLLLHLATYLAACGLTWKVLGPGAPPAPDAHFAAWAAVIALVALTAIRSAAPLGWIARRLARRWRVPLLALAVGLFSWRAMALVEGLWGGLSAFTLSAVAWLLRRVSDGVLVDPVERVIGLGAFEVEVAPVCSGIDGVGLTVVFQALWIALARSRLRTGRALLLLPLGAAVALAGNAVRIAVLVWLGASGQEELAIGGFHSKVGWLLFAGIALATMAAAERVAWLRAPEVAEVEPGALPATAAAYVAPLVGALGTALVTGMLSGSALDRAYGLRVLVPALVLLAVRRSLPPLLSGSPLALLAGLAVGGLWLLGAKDDGSTLSAELAGLTPAARAGWIGVRLLGACLVVPVIEELAFRGFLLPWLAAPGAEPSSAPGWSPVAAVISSLAFGAIHQRWLLGALAGLVFALVLRRRGRLADAILAHAAANGVVAAGVLLGGRWDLWG